MKKNIGLLSILVGSAGLVLLLVAYMYRIPFLPILGLVMLVAGIAGGVVDGWINRLPPRARLNEDTPENRLDKGQLPPGGYIHDSSGSRLD